MRRVQQEYIRPRTSGEHQQNQVNKTNFNETMRDAMVALMLNENHAVSRVYLYNDRIDLTSETLTGKREEARGTNSTKIS